DLEVRPGLVAVRVLDFTRERETRGEHRFGRRLLPGLQPPDHRLRAIAMPLERRADPFVECARRASLADAIEDERAERAVAQPAEVVDAERGAGDERAVSRLTVPQHTEAALGEGISADRRHQPFRAPDARPLTNCRWKIANTAITGKTAITDAAKTSPQLVACCP